MQQIEASQPTAKTGRPSEYQADDIIRAGESLQAEGRSVTGFALRKIVGGGDPNRLRQVWEQHLAAKSVVSAEPVADLPPEIADRWGERKAQLIDSLEALVVDLNDLAVRAADRRTTEIVKGAQASVQKMEGEVAEGAQQLAATEEKLFAVETERDELQTKLEAEKQARQAVEVKLAEAVERARSADAALRESQQREAGLQQQLGQAQQAEQAARQSEAEAKGQAAVLTAQHAEDMQRLARLDIELNTARDACGEAQGELTKATASLSAANDKLIAALDDAKKTRAAAATAERQAAERAGELKEVRAELERLRGELAVQAKAKAAPAKKPGEPKA